MLCQDFKNFEFIIIDGDSIDGSAEYLVENQAYFTYWVSEPDEGIYDAMNKGISVSTGDYLFFLNSGDCLHSKETLDIISLKIFCCRDIYYGNVILKYEDREIFHTYPENLRFSHFLKGTICHQAVILSKRLFLDLGTYNTEYKIISDWEFLIRSIFVYRATYKKLDLIFSEYDMSGVSSQQANKSQIKNDKSKVLDLYFHGFLEDYSQNEENCNRLMKINRVFDPLFFKRLDHTLFRKSLKLAALIFKVIYRLK